MTKKHLNLISYLLCIMMAFSLLTGCGNKQQATTGGEEKVMRLAGGDAGIITPYLHYKRGPGLFKLKFIYDSLLEKGDKGLIPWLAEEWKIENDGKDYVFKLNKNAVWHDGKKLTADDVKFSYEYYLKHPPLVGSLMRNGKSIIKSIYVIDPQTIKVSLFDKSATDLETLGTLYILPKHIWENVDDPLSFTDEEAFIGSGPYILSDYSAEEGTYRFTANEKFWGPKPLFSAVEFVPVSDGLLAFDNKEIDAVTVPPDLLDKYKSKEYGHMVTNPESGPKIMFNMKKRSELADINLRKAMAYALDRQAMVDKIERGAAIVASMGFVSPYSQFYNDGVTKYEYNPEKAKELLAGKKYEFEMLTSNSTNEVKLAQLIKGYFEEIGITINLKSVDTKTRDSAIIDDNYELVLTVRGGCGKDPDVLRTLYGSDAVNGKQEKSGSGPGMKGGQQAAASDNQQNKQGEEKGQGQGSGQGKGKGQEQYREVGVPGYCNQELDKLAVEQLGETDIEKRKEIIGKMQEIIADQVPQLLLYYRTYNFVYRKDKSEGWVSMYDHHTPEHSKLSYVDWK